MAETAEATTSTPTELLAAGRRHLAMKDYNSAVDCFARACECLVQEHGEGSDACGEVYLWYGKALLGLSREESGVFTDRVPRDDNPDDEEEEEQEENGEVTENGEAEAEQLNTDKTEEQKTEVEVKVNGTVEKIEAESTTNELPSSSKMEAAEGPSTSAGEGNEVDESEANLEEDDVENLQLAWEMLELARGVYQRRAAGGAAGARAQLADAHFTLGEVALESETYDKAVDDLQSCLEIQKEIYPTNDRRIAETHFQIGLASSLASKFEEAILHFKNAANILETRIKILENPTSATEDATVKKYSSADPLYSVEAEIKELKELLPEIHEKIQDMMDYKAETMKSIREHMLPSNGSSHTNGAGSSSSAASSSSATKAPVQNINHLIKRKRKSSEETPTTAKKANTTGEKS